MGLIILAINRQTQALVSYKNCVTTVPAMFQGNTQAFQIYTVDPDPTNLLGGFVPVNMSGSGLRMALGDTPTGTSGGPTPIALQDTWTWDPVTLSFSASLNLNVVAVDTFLESAAAKSAYLEINQTASGGRTTLLQTAVSLRAVVDELTSAAPTPVDQYLTKAEISAVYAK